MKKTIKITESEIIKIVKDVINETHMFDKKKYFAELKSSGDFSRLKSSIENFLTSTDENRDSNRIRMKEVGEEIISKLIDKFGKIHKTAIRSYIKNFATKMVTNHHIKNDDLSESKINEQENDRYMFFSNLEQIKRQCELLLDLDENQIESILENGHDWAQDHVATSKESIDQVFDFIMNETKKSNPTTLGEGKKKTGTKLCSRGKAAAKAKFKVYPSAYSNGFAVQVCKGRMKGLDGKKRCSPPYC